MTWDAEGRLGAVRVSGFSHTGNSWAALVLAVLATFLMVAASSGSALVSGTANGQEKSSPGPSFVGIARGPVAPPRIFNGKPGAIPHFGKDFQSSGTMVVDPTGGYSAEPAPMGIADFGVTSSSTAYTYSTSEFLGTFSWTSENMGGSGSDFTIQLNVVLKFVLSGTTYAYWVQDVAEPTNNGGNSLTMSFINNIWNFSAGTGAMNSNSLSGNGTINSYGSSDYYEYGPVSGLPGDDSTISAPGSFGLLVRSYTATSGVPEVAFEYIDSAVKSPETYDNVIFPFAKGATDDGYTVDGTQYVPYGSLFYDAELDLGGPGGGSGIDVEATTDSDMTLYYFNGDNFESTPGAWNFGGDTGETSSNVESIGQWTAQGTLETNQLDGTAKDAAPGSAYDPSAIGNVNATTTCAVADGVLAVGSHDWGFNGSWADVNLGPGTYNVWMNSSSNSDNLGAVTVTAGGSQKLNASALCNSVVITPPVPSLPSADVGQTVTFTTTLTQPGSGGVTYAWTPSSASLNCTASTTATYTCTPTSPGTGYTVSVTATDSKGKSDSQTSASLTVYADPIASASVSAASADIGQSTTFSATASSGSGGYSYAWTGLPPGCATNNTASLACIPSAAGTYGVHVVVKDSDGFPVTSNAVSLKVYTDPSVAVPEPSAPGATVGESVTFTANASGGTGTYTSYSWSGFPSGECTNLTTVTATCDFTAETIFNVTAKVTDSNGFTSQASAPLEFQVYPALSSVTVSPASVTLFVDANKVFTADPSCSGGQCPAGGTYTWTLSSSGASLNSSSGVSVTLTAGPEETTVILTVSLLLGVSEKTATSSITIIPTLQSVEITPGSMNIAEGSSETFSAAPACMGGACPSGIAYQWGLSNQLGSIGQTSGNSTSFLAGDAVGNVTLYLNATLDGVTHGDKIIVSITAQPPAGKPALFGSLPDQLTLELILAAIVAGVVVAALIRRKRNKEHEASQAPPPWQAPPQQLPPWGNQPPPGQPPWGGPQQPPQY